MRSTTDDERVKEPVAVELDRVKGAGRMGFAGDERPLHGLFRIPLVDAIKPPD